MTQIYALKSKWKLTLRCLCLYYSQKQSKKNPDLSRDLHFIVERIDEFTLE
jgi:hypothetical protein